jgi:hypothetical protein
MAIDYAELFADIGSIVSGWNSLEVIADTTLPGIQSAIAAEFGVLTLPIDTLVNDVAAMKSATDSWRAILARYVSARLLDRTSVVDQLGVVAPSIATVIDALISDMSSAPQTVKRQAVTVGSPAAGASNVGDGSLLVTKVLDGFNKPSRDILARRVYAGLSSEVTAPAETFTLQCTADSYSGGATSGAERFSLQGFVQSAAANHAAEGSGIGAAITSAGATAMPANGGFDAFTNNAPNSWTVAAGTVGTHIGPAGSSDTYRGANALKLTGDGALAAIQLRQSVAMTPLRMYAVMVRLKKTASATSGTVVIEPTGTGFTADSNQKISVAVNTLTTSYVLYSMFLMAPATRPSDWSIRIGWQGTPNASQSVFVDDLRIAPVTYHGGIGFAIAPGDTPFTIGDSFSVGVTNNAAGVFQEFFRRVYRVQLPSADSPSISDSLAE